MLNYENVPSDTAPLSSSFCQKKDFNHFTSPYLLDINGYDFLLLPKINIQLKRRHFVTLDNIQRILIAELRETSIEVFQHCYQELKQHISFITLLPHLINTEYWILFLIISLFKELLHSP